MSNQHFGNPLNEQRQLAEGKAIVLREDQAVIRLEGEEAFRWIHSLTSQNIANLAPGDSAETLILSPSGHVEFQLKVIAFQGGLFLISAKDVREALISWLTKMKFRTKVEISSSDLFVLGAFADLGLAAPVFIDPYQDDPVGSVRYASERANFPYREYLVSDLPDVPRAGLMAFQALRIAAGRPDQTDIDERTLPHELDWLSSAVHLSKGCYRGQETVAKVHNLGHPPRRLVILHLEHGDLLLQPGESVFYSDKEVGKILAGALHFELGSIALALISRVTPYLDLEVVSGSSRYRASQQVLVPFDAGKAANLPRPAAFKLSGKK